MQAASTPRCWPNRWTNLLTVRWEWFIAGSECINLANHANLFGAQTRIVWLVATSTVCWFFMPFRWFLVHAGFRRAGLCHDAKKWDPPWTDSQGRSMEVSNHFRVAYFDGIPTRCSFQMTQLETSLVGGLEHELYDFPYIGNVIIPTDELIFFKGVGIPPTSSRCIHMN